MKKEIFYFSLILSLILILSLSLVSAFSFSNFFNKITGKTIDSSECGTYSYQTPIDAKASSEYSISYPAMKAIDGSIITSWYSSYTKLDGKDKWIYFDLGEKGCINGIKLYVYPTYYYVPITFDIDVSDDTVSWRNIKKDLKINKEREFVEFKFDANLARYIRITETDVSQSDIGALSEIEVSVADYNSGTEKLKCSDGTLYNQCSSTKPKYCNNGALINKCSSCDCDAGKECQNDGSCKESVKKCSDGTIYNSCSTTKPLYCNDGNLINKCSSCGCLTGQQCQSDGSCKIPVKNCSDGTSYGQCSTTKPFYCDQGGHLFNWCQVCGCDPGQECQSDGSCKTSVQKCSDGTSYGQCSLTKPLYCNDGNLINKCSSCGCDSGQECQSDGNCKTSVQKCSDGTLYNQCSSIKPKYCSNGNLINQCGSCGCDLGQECQSDGSCKLKESSIEAEINVETIKDEYNLWELVKLDESLGANQGSNNLLSNQEFGFEENNKEYEEFISNSFLSTEVFSRSYGYIIEFKEKSILEKKSEMESEIIFTEEKLGQIKAEYEDVDKDGWNFINPASISSRSFKRVKIYTNTRKLNSLKNNFDAELENQEKKISKKHRDFKNDLIKSGQSMGITGDVVSGDIINDAVEFTKTFNGIVLNISEDEALILKERFDEVMEVHLNGEVNITLMDAVPLINADDVWELKDNQGRQITGEGMTIAIIDTGVDYTHPDLGGCFGSDCKVVGGYDFVNDDNNPMDDHYHGTHCAGVAAGNGDWDKDGVVETGEGLNGVAPDAKIYAYKVLSSSGHGSWSQVMSGVERAVDPNNDGDFSDHVDVISMSLGGKCKLYSKNCGPDDPMSIAIDNAVSNGVIAVIAAGNSGPDFGTVGTPGTARKAITVGATYKRNYNENLWDKSPRVNQITYFSSRGPVKWVEGEITKPDIVAPGALICSARYDSVFPEGKNKYYKPCYDDEHIQLAGTSMSAPHVAGATALIKQAHQDWSPMEIKSAIKSTAKDLGYSPNIQGAGAIDVLKGVNLKDLPPIADIQTNGEKTGISLDIIGTSYAESGFENYTLYYSDSYINENWTKLYASSEKIRNGLLYTWDIRDLPEGEYYLRLVVKTKEVSLEVFNHVSIVFTKITYPVSLAGKRYYKIDERTVFEPGERINIKGIVGGYNFDHFEIEYCDEDNHCSKEGISLVNGGSKAIIDDTMGYWIVPQKISLGYYFIRLTNYYNQISKIVNTKFYIETEFQEGWPVDVPVDEECKGCFMFFGDQPTLADMDQDGDDDVVVTYGNTISVFDDDGSYLSGFPLKFKESSCCSKGFINSGAAVGDIDNDSYNEIIFRTVAVMGNHFGRIYVVRHNGEFQPGWENGKAFDTNGSLSIKGYITISDIDNDGFKEIMFLEYSLQSAKLYVVDKDGVYLPGWPKVLAKKEDYPKGVYLDWSDPITVKDFNNDGKKEIIITGNIYSGYPEYPQNKIVTLFDYEGNILSGWPKSFEHENCDTYHSPAYVVDINEDGFDEILFQCDAKIYAFNYDGELIDGWPISVEGGKFIENAVRISGPPFTIGDIDNDNKLDLIFPTVHDYEGFRGIGACDNEGKMKKGFPTFLYYTFKGFVFGNVTYSNTHLQLGNLMGNTNQIFGPPFFEHVEKGNLPPYYVFDSDGTLAEGFPKYLEGRPWAYHTPVGDIDGDGDNELLIYLDNGKLVAWDLGGSPENNEWPQYHHDAQHTGDYEFERESVSFERCSDGTLYNSCSTTKPLYCSNGSLINQCSSCDCDAGKECQSDGSCKESVKKCSDGTLYNSCSTTKPLYCSNGSLINQCSSCDCDAGKECQNDGSCKEKEQLLPKSILKNTGIVDINGHLIMKVQKLEGAVWVDEKIIVDDFSKNNLRKIIVGGYLSLGEIWDSAGNYITQKLGIFRVYVALLDVNGTVIVTSNDEKIEDTAEFNVITQEKICSDGTLYNQCSSTKPKYCSNGNLINKCGSCGCDSGQQCQSDGNCKSKESGECGTYSYQTPIDAKASSEYSISYPAMKAIDGSIITSWYSSYTKLDGKDKWIYFDLGEKGCINGIKLYVYPTYYYVPITFDIDVSDDTVSWRNIKKDLKINKEREFVEFKFDANLARYIRITETDVSQSDIGVLSEIEVSVADYN